MDDSVDFLIHIIHDHPAKLDNARLALTHKEFSVPNPLFSVSTLTPIALALALTACGGGSDSPSSSTSISGGGNSGGGTTGDQHLVDANTYVQIASWAYGRISTQQAWAWTSAVQADVMQNALDGFGGITAPYNMSTRTRDCGVSGTDVTEYIITAPSLNAGDATVESANDCVEFTIVGNRTENSDERNEILAGTLAQGLEMRTTRTATYSHADSSVETQSYDYSYRLSEDTDEDHHFEAINLPGFHNDTLSDSVTIHAFKHDENGDNESTIADLDISIGSVDAGNFAFSRFRLTTLGTLEEFVYPRSSLFDSDEEKDESGDDGSKDRMLAGGVKVTFDGGQIVTIEPSGDSLKVDVSLDSNADGSPEQTSTLLLKDFRIKWAELVSF